MAEAAAVLGLVASILQVVDYGTKVVSRLNDFRTSADEAPRAFRDILVELPLLLNTLDKTRQQAESGAIDKATQEALLPVVHGCQSQINALYEILDKVLPKKPDSSLQKSIKAVKSVSYEKNVEQITSTLRKYVQALTYHQAATGVAGISISSPKQTFFGVPFDRDRNFIGRVAILEQVEHALKNRQHIALAGIGGVGKSQIAIEAGYRYKEIEPSGHVLWVHASTVDRFDQAYKNIFRRLVAGSNTNAVDLYSLQAVCDWLSENGPWLLIIDNADDSDIFFSLPGGEVPLMSYIPHHPAGSILVTTRNRRAGERLVGRENCMAISSPQDDEAETLLRSKIAPETWNGESAKRLINTLANLPLALSQAAAFISENDLTLEEYLEVLSTDDSELTDLLCEDSGDVRRDFQIGNSVLKTWKISFDQITRQKPRAAEIMSIMAVLDRQGLPKSLLERQNERKSDFITAIGTLQAFSLINTEKGNRTTYGMHRLVHIAMQHWLKLQGSWTEWQRLGLQLLKEQFPEGSFNNWPECEALYPHARVVIEYEFEDKESRLDHTILQDLIAKYEMLRGSLQIARVRQELVCTSYVEILGENDISTLQARAQLAEIMRMQGSPAAAALYKELIGPVEEALGPYAENTLVIKMNLALSLRDDKEDEVLLLEVLKCLEDTGRTNDFLYLLALDNLGVVCLSQGRRQESITLHRRALAEKERLLGQEHQSTLISLNNLEVALGDTEVHEKRERNTLAKQQRILGDEHPDTLLSLINLSRTLVRKRQFEEAEKLALEAIAGMERVLGVDHPRTMTAMNSLGLIYVNTKDYDRAKPYLENLLEAFDRVLGQDDSRTRTCWWGYLGMPSKLWTLGNTRTWPSDHPVSIAKMNNRALELLKEGDNEMASELLREALALYKQPGEKDCPWALFTRYNLAKSLIELYSFVEAEDLIRYALAERLKYLKPDDEQILETMNVLGIVLWRQGGDKTAEAEEVFRELLKSWDNSQPLSLDRLHVVSNLGLIEISQGDYPAAEKRYRKLVKDREQAQGTNHHDTLTSMLSLSMALGYQQLYVEAEELNRKALEGLKVDPGPKHPTTLLSQSTLANILTKRGKYEEAEATICEAIALREESLGSNHPFTLKSMGRLAEIYELQERYEEALRTQEIAYVRCCQRLGQDHPESLGHESELVRIRSLTSSHQGDIKEVDEGS